MNPSSTSGPSSEYNSSKHKNRVQYHDSTTSSTSNNNNTARDQKSHSVNGTSSTWYDGHRDHRSDHSKRERSRERDWSRDRKRTADSRARESNFREEEPRERLRDEQPPAYSSYNYTGTDPSYVDNNRRTLGMMTNMSSYGLIAAMNSSQWAMSPLDGMNMNNTVNPTTGMNMNPNIDMNTSGTSINPFAFMGMAGDPNLFGMMGMGNFGQFGMMNNDANMVSTLPKEIIRFSKSVLYPPNPYLPPPTTRDKPPGCKTIFVGGLPEKVTEEVVREVFETCGEILTIRMSKKNFCHIRFASEAFIDNALFFSGYRIKIRDESDPPYVGRFHVDFAQARDDQYEYECRQRSLQREARHRERIEQEYYNPPTPPPVVPYSDHEAAILGEKLRGEDTFQQAIFTLITWLERGECNKRNAGYFYSMIQSTNSHVRRLMNEKLKYEDELNKARMMLRQQMRGTLIQFTDIGKVFTAASLQKVWDHFTKPQRKNIDLWKKQTEEIKNAHVEEVLGDRIEDEMELSDDEGDTASRKADSTVMVTDHFGNKVDALEEINKLKEENDNLKCQLEASENEVSVVKSETNQEREIKDRQIQALRQALQNAHQELYMLTQKRVKDEAELKELRAKLKKKDPKSEKESGECSHDLEDDKILSIKDYSDSAADNEIPRESLGFPSAISSTSNNLFVSVSEKSHYPESEARLTGLISTFLNAHPFGASIDYICSYLHQIDSTVRARDVEALMKKYPTVFNEESTGIGASLEKKWTFCGFKSQI